MYVRTYMHTIICCTHRYAQHAEIYGSYVCTYVLTYVHMYVNRYMCIGTHLLQVFVTEEDSKVLSEVEPRPLTDLYSPYAL